MRVFITSLNPYWQEVEDRGTTKGMLKDFLIYMGMTWLEYFLWIAFIGVFVLGIFIGEVL